MRTLSPFSSLPALSLGVCLGLGLAGCAVEDEPMPPVDGELQLGGAPLGGEGWVELTGGAEVELVPGAQGGFHVWLNARVTGAAGPLYFEREARRADSGELVLRSLPQAVDVPEDAMEDWWETPSAWPAFMCPSPIGIVVHDQPITFSVELVDDLGEVLAHDEITLIPRCPASHLDFCHEICSG